mgnify:CR=1 FL=1
MIQPSASRVARGHAPFSQCMHEGCKSSPEHECIWADGRGRAWFCGKHYGPWQKAEGDREIVKERKAKSGVVGKKYGEEPKQASQPDSRVAAKFLHASLAHKKSVALMKFLSGFARTLGPKAGKHVYVVGGAVRDFVLDRPIKDVDAVVDAVNLGHDSEWFADKLIRAVPARMNKKTNQWGVVLLKVLEPWDLNGLDMEGEEIEIANARTESYEEGGYKPTGVAPSTIQDDVYRRELTYNTLLIRLMALANGPDKKDILDLTGCGLRDLAEGRMQCPADPGKTFSDDPSRMIRVIKFALRYGHKLTPDTRAAIKQNAPKLKNIPSSHLAQLLTQIVLTESTWKKALAMMEDLGLLEPVRELILKDKGFRSTLENYVRDQRMDLVFGLLDVGLPLGASIQFLPSSEQVRVREITLGMERDDAWEFLGMLKNPGNAYKDKSFVPDLARKYDLELRDMGRLGAQVRQIGQKLLLDNPDLAQQASRLKQMISRELEMNSDGLKQKWGATIAEAVLGVPRQGSVKIARSYTKIAMFDFDGTLFRSWEKTPTWWKGSELDDGPFSFFVREESLGEPCVPDRPSSNYWIPTPVQEAKKAIREASTYTVVVTGRIRRHSKRVKELLGQKGLRFDAMYFNPGMSAARFKVVVLRNLLAGLNTVSEIDIWENENITTYESDLKATSKALGRPLKIQTFPIHQPAHELICSPEDFHLPSQNSAIPREVRMAAETGDGSGVGLFIPVPKEISAQFPRKEEDTSPQHVTFLYVGAVPKARQDEFLQVLETALVDLDAPVQASLGELDRFVTPTGKVVFSTVRFSKDLSAVRDQVWAKLEGAGFDVADKFPRYNPHSTIAYLDDPHSDMKLVAPTGSWQFGEMEVWGLPKKHVIPFGERVSLREPLPEASVQRVARLLEMRGSVVEVRRRRGQP